LWLIVEISFINLKIKDFFQFRPIGHRPQLRSTLPKKVANDRWAKHP